LGENIVYHTYENGLISKIYKGLNSIARTLKKLKMGKGPDRHFSKEDT
jgi:hypothetical protein